MGSRKEKEAIVILLDVGANMRQLSSSTKTFLESSKECISQIVQRKLFSKSVDELGLILFGCDKTNNKLAKELGGYSNIDVLTDHLSLASWDLLRFISNVDASSNCQADWFDAIIVAVQFIRDETESRKFAHHKIVIFSNFSSFVSDDNIDQVVGAMKEQNINLVVIGPDVQNDEYVPGKKKPKLQTDGEILISNIVDKLEGSVICTFDDALSELMYVQRKSVKPTPWNVLLTISNKIKIPVSAYKKIAEITPMKWMQEAIDDQNAGVVRESAFVKLDRENDVEVEVPRDETVKGYQFGSTVIPFGESEESMNYKSGPKGLYLIGCTARKRIPLHLLMGNGSYIVVAKQGDDVANKALNAFIEALKEQEAVGIARKVYTENSAALIGALFPVITDEHRYLVYVELPFAEDEHIYKFPSLADVNLSKEQLNAVDNLINEMDLDETEERSEMYDLTRIYDPREQHVLRCITEKALNPERTLSDDLSTADVLKPLPDIIKSCESTLMKIKELFPLQVIEPKKKKFKGALATDSKAVNDDVKNNALFPTTSAKADTDSALMNDDKSFLEVCKQMQSTVEKMVEASESPNKIMEHLKALRKNCISKYAEPYNECISKVKNLIIESENSAFWELIQNEKLGLISKSELVSSRITAEEAEEFLNLPKEEVDSLYGSLDTGPSQDLLDEL